MSSINTLIDLDVLYYRNKATQRRMARHSTFHLLKNYTTCSQSQVDATALPTYTNYVMTTGTTVPTQTGIPTPVPTIAPTPPGI